MRKFLAFAIAVVSSMTMNGCITAADDARELPADQESVTTGEISVQTCFTCDLDPTIRSCSSIASRARYVCERACIVCQFGDCFRGHCEMDLLSAAQP